MRAILTNNTTGERIEVHATAAHPASSYGIPVWVDDENNAYLQVGIEHMQPLYSISDIDDIDEYNKYIPKHGGFRPNSGRPRNDRNVTLSVRISQQAMDKLNNLTSNKSEYIDNLIMQQETKKSE